MDREAVNRIAATQRGLITSAQFQAANASKGALRWAVNDGWLRSYRWRGLYEVLGAPEADLRPLLGACLVAGPDVVAAGLSAAWVYGAADVLAGELDVLAFNGREPRLRGVRTRTTRQSPGGLVTVRNSVPVVSAALCVVQLAGELNYLAERVANDFVKRNLTGFGRILRCLDDVAPHGRGARWLRPFCERELGVTGHDDSPGARVLGRALIAAGLAPFETQHKVGPYLLDFAWPWAKVGLEYQGRFDHTLTVNEIDADTRRRAHLGALGWLVLDATVGTLDDVVRQTASALETYRRAVDADLR